MLLDAGCGDGVVAACGEAARTREFGDGVPIDTKGAFEGYTALCDNGVPRGCMAAGNMLAKGTAPGGPDAERARSLLAGACAMDDALSCAAYAQHLGVRGELEEARVVASKACQQGEPTGCGIVEMLGRLRRARLDPNACDGGDPLVCLDYATALSQGLGGPDEVARGGALLQAVCDGGNATACVNLGVVASKGLGTGAADPARAYALYRRACSAGEPTGCFDAALLLHEGRGIERDIPASLAAMAKLCDAAAGDPTPAALVPARVGVGLDLEASWRETRSKGCVMSGNYHSDAGSEDEARDGWRRGCELGQAVGCTNYALDLLKPGLGRAGDASAAIALLEKACAAGDPHGCAALGRELLLGGATKADPARGQRLLNEACRSGSDAACAALGVR